MSAYMHGFANARVVTRCAVGVCACLAAFASQVAHTQGLPHYTAKEELRIDGEKANLVPINGFAVDPRGQIFVGQTQDNRILVFDSTGALVKTIGRKGDGPGEFRGLVNLGFVGDTLWAWDANNLRLMFFRADGKQQRAITIPRLTSPDMRFSPPLIRGVRSDGSFLAAGITHLSREVVEVFANAKGVSQRQLSARPRAPGGTFGFSNYEGGNWKISNEVNPPIVIGAQDGGKLAVAKATLSGENAGFGSVVMLSSAGDTIFTRTYAITIKPIPQSTIDSALQAIEQKNPSAAAALRKYPIGKVYPPLEYMRIARDGALLLAFYTDGPTRDFFLLKPTGEIEASLTVPREVVVRAFDSTHLWGFTRDENDLESIVRLRLVKDSPNN